MPDSMLEQEYEDKVSGTEDNFQDEFEITEDNDSMDGDWDSAMTSAGMGTDEDYGYYGED